MGLQKEILDYISQFKTTIDLKDIYNHFNGKAEKSTIRGRLNEAVSTKQILRPERGLYLIAGAKVEAIIEHCDAEKGIFQIMKANIYYDLAFFDIAYACGGQKGGNRQLNPYDTVNPEQLADLLKETQKVLRTENSQLYFMMAGGKSSQGMAKKYLSAFEQTNLKLAAKGSYTKTNKNGSVCNIGKYPLPAENIFIYSHDGKLSKPEDTQLDFTLQRPPLQKSGGYPTQKPLELLMQIIRQSTNVGDKILDFFGGSGITLEASVLLKRFCHIFDISKFAIEEHILKKAEAVLDSIMPMPNNNVSFYNDKKMLNFM